MDGRGLPTAEDKTTIVFNHSMEKKFEMNKFNPHKETLKALHKIK